MAKILVSLTYYLPNVSGVTIYAQILAQELAKNQQLTILTSRFRNNLSKKETIGRTKVIRAWAPIKINKGVLMPSFPFISLIEVLKTDLVICHLPQLEAFWLVFWAKLFKKPVILVHHCEFGNAPGITNQLIKLITYLPHYLCYLWATKIIAYTQDYARHSIFLSKFLNKTAFILPPVIVGKSDRNKIKKVAKLIGKTKDTVIIGFVGRIGWEKGIDILLKTIPFLEKEFNKFKIVLVGPYQNVIGDNTYQKLKPLLEKYQNRVTLTGPVPHQELINYYLNFDCLVLPSTNNLETFGIVQAEAMISGCPVVATNLPGVRVPIRLTKMGKVVPVGKPRPLAKAIIQVVKNREELRKRKLVAQKTFSKTNFLLKWKKVVQEVLLY